MSVFSSPSHPVPVGDWVTRGGKGYGKWLSLFTVGTVEVFGDCLATSGLVILWVDPMVYQVLESVQFCTCLRVFLLSSAVFLWWTELSLVKPKFNDLAGSRVQLNSSGAEWLSQETNL